jgi:nitrogen fixation protein FixH
MTGTLTGRGVLFWLLGFFAVIMAMNAWYVMLSIKTFRGEDEQLPYLQGVAYNQTLAHRAEQKALGWQATVTLAPLPAGKAKLAVVLRDAMGRPLQGLALAGELRHPSDENRDRPLTLRPAGPGLYEAEISQVAPGAWDAVVRTRSGEPFEMVRRLWLR